MVPPLKEVSGLTVNPLVKPIEGGKSTLISIKYNSEFRDLTYTKMNEIIKPAMDSQIANGMVKEVKNKKLAEKIKKMQEEKEAQAQAVDPKGQAKGGKAAPAPPAKKEEPKQPAGKPVKKTQQQIDEEEAEEARLKKEAEEAEIARLKQLEDDFDRDGELIRMGGRVTNFDIADNSNRTQHYDWLLPVYFKQ